MQVVKQVFRVTNVKIFNLKRLFLIVLVLVLVYYPFTVYINKKDIKVINSDDNEPDDINISNNKNNNNNEIKIPTGKDGCNIIDTNHKQYTVTLDGVTYPQYLYLSQNKSINYDCLSKSTPVKKIFSWNKFYGERNMGYGDGDSKSFQDKHCPITNCQVIDDKSKLNEAEFVVILVTDSMETMPPKGPRPYRQRWVYANIESPYYHPQSWSHFNGFFNYTADYLTESEFGINYESQKRFLWALNETFNENHDYHAGKTGFVAALISNCGAQNERMNYINELRKYVAVEVHGACGVPCPANVGDCREWVGRKYKFFFAFENSNCKDYITEKFFLMLKYDIIPVVIGGGNYSRFVPKSGYINGLDFKSAKDLGTYLNYLDSNKTAFNSYFKWKKHVNFLDYTVSYAFICEMCIQAHLDHYFEIKKKTIHDFDKYWNKQTQCFNTKVTEIDSVKYYKFDSPT
jgi:hypothetical protein